MLTKAEAKRKSDGLYQMSVELSRDAKQQFGGADIDALEAALGAYCQILARKVEPTPEGEDPATIEVSEQILQQMALLASGPLARILSYRYKILK